MYTTNEIADGCTSSLLELIAAGKSSDTLFGLFMCGAVVHQMVMPVTGDLEAFCVEHEAFGRLVFAYRELSEPEDQEGVDELR